MPFSKNRTTSILGAVALAAFVLSANSSEATDPQAPTSYSAEELASIARGKPLYALACASCHNEDGHGCANLAPTLAGTDWVTGSKERLALVVGQGLTGPIEVNDALWNQAMLAYGKHPDLSGEGFNDLLNFLRASWGNQASLYQKGEARSYLEKHSDRDEAWIIEEFEDLGLAPEL